VQDDHFNNLKQKLKETSDFAFDKLTGIRGIDPIRSKAAMYMMVKINIDEFEGIEDDVDFCKKLLNEECVLVFPSQCFFAKNFFRMVVCTSLKNVEEFASRLQDFCRAHYKRD
jgi:tyrosine aminotransferase